MTANRRTARSVVPSSIPTLNGALAAVILVGCKSDAWDKQAAHAHSSNHRAEILDSSVCGCFYCLATFPPVEIQDWVDEDSGGQGQTALCPRCGIDSVIGGRSGFPISEAF